MKILVVDDDPDIVEAVNICFALRWPDAEVLEAPDGTTALDRLGRDAPDVVILDLGLPDMDGFEVCEEIRKTSQVPVLILTALTLVHRHGKHRLMLRQHDRRYFSIPPHPVGKECLKAIIIRGQDNSYIPVEKPQAVVILRDQDRPTGVPMPIRIQKTFPG